MKPKIFYGRQNISESDVKKVVKVLKSDYLTQGNEVSKFEDALCNYVSSKYSLVVNSATSALHLSCIALGVKEGDNVWTSPISFVASSNCALYLKANVDFVDIDYETNNISIKALTKKLEIAKKNNSLPKVLIVVHLSGLSCDMLEINKLAKKYSFSIIEDSSHAIGGSYKGSMIGSCKYSDISVFSFHPVKIITTGEGGAITTNSKKLYSSILKLRSHGITRNYNEQIKRKNQGWYYEQQLLGFNYRMTDFQAALGNNQLKRIDKFLNKREVIANRYHKNLSHTSLVLPITNNFGRSSLHLFIIKIKSHRNGLYDFLVSNGVFTNLHYIPIYRQPFYENTFKFKFQNFENAEKYYNEALSLPIYYDLKLSEVDMISELIISFLQKYSQCQP